MLVVAAAHPLGLDRPGVLDPSQVIDDVDVEVDEASASRPEETVEALNLIHEVADAGGLGRRRKAADQPGHAIAPLKHDVPYFSVMHALRQLLQMPAVP